MGFGLQGAASGSVLASEATGLSAFLSFLEASNLGAYLIELRDAALGISWDLEAKDGPGLSG